MLIVCLVVVGHPEHDVVGGIGAGVADAIFMEAEHVVIFPHGRRHGTTDDRLQVGQVDEGTGADGEQRAGQVDLEQAPAGIEGEVANALHTLWQGNAGDPCTHAEGHVVDAAHGIAGAIDFYCGWHDDIARVVLRDAGIVAAAQDGYGLAVSILAEHVFGGGVDGVRPVAYGEECLHGSFIDTLCIAQLLGCRMKVGLRESSDGSTLFCAQKKFNSGIHMVQLKCRVFLLHPFAESIAGRNAVGRRDDIVLIAVIEVERVLGVPALGQVVVREGMLQVLHDAAPLRLGRIYGIHIIIIARKYPYPRIAQRIDKVTIRNIVVVVVEHLKEVVVGVFSHDAVHVGRAILLDHCLEVVRVAVLSVLALLVPLFFHVAGGVVLAGQPVGDARLEEPFAEVVAEFMIAHVGVAVAHTL